MSFLLFPLHGVVLIIDLAALAITLAAMIDVLLRPGNAFVAAGKQPKGYWLMFLVLGAFVSIVGVIAALVYFLDVRPAVLAIGGGGGGSRPGGSSSDGPYGPFRG